MKCTPGGGRQEVNTRTRVAEETPSSDETTLIGCEKLPPLLEVLDGFTLPATALAFEARYIAFALETSAGSITKAANMSGISHQNLSLHQLLH